MATDKVDRHATNVAMLRAAASVLAEGVGRSTHMENWSHFLDMAISDPDQCLYCELEVVLALQAMLTRRATRLTEMIHPKTRQRKVVTDD